MQASAWGRVECELCGLLDDKLHFIKTVCVEANTTIRILGSNPLSAPDLLLFLHVHTGGRKCIVCHKRKWIWNTLHRDSFTEALVYVACDKKTNVKCINFELNSLKVYWKHSSHRRRFSYLCLISFALLEGNHWKWTALGRHDRLSSSSISNDWQLYFSQSYANAVFNSVPSC